MLSCSHVLISYFLSVCHVPIYVFSAASVFHTFMSVSMLITPHRKVNKKENAEKEGKKERKKRKSHNLLVHHLQTELFQVSFLFIRIFHVRKQAI